MRAFARLASEPRTIVSSSLSRDSLLSHFGVFLEKLLGIRVGQRKGPVPAEAV